MKNKFVIFPLVLSSILMSGIVDALPNFPGVERAVSEDGFPINPAVRQAHKDPYAKEIAAENFRISSAYRTVELARDLGAYRSFQVSSSDLETYNKLVSLLKTDLDWTASESKNVSSEIVEFLIPLLSDQNILARGIRPSEILLLNIETTLSGENTFSIKGEFIINPQLLTSDFLNLSPEFVSPQEEVSFLADPFTQSHYEFVLKQLYRYMQKGNALPEELTRHIPQN